MRALITLINRRLLDRLPPGFRRFVLYAFCGGIAAAADFTIYTILFTLGLWYQAANFAGYITGTLVSFVLNRSITFQVKDAPIRRLITFCGVAAVGYVSSSTALWFLVERLHVNELIAKLLSLVVVVAVQFTLNTLVTFRVAKSVTQS